MREAGTEESLIDPVVLEPPPIAPTLDPRRITTPQPRDEAGPSREPHWKDIDLSFFEYLETPFKQVREELTHLHNHYFWPEHITQDVSKALDNYGLGNILQVLAKKTDWSKVDALEIEKAQLAAQVVAMTLELAQKNKEIRRYQAE